MSLPSGCQREKQHGDGQTIVALQKAWKCLFPVVQWDRENRGQKERLLKGVCSGGELHMRASIASLLMAVGLVCAWGGTRAVAKTDVPFHRGVNLTGWLQVGSARQIQFTMFTKQDLVNIKSLGCDVIRLPINLHHMTSGAPDYTVDPLFFYFLDQIVDWCEELQIHLILDNHTGDVDASGNTDVNIDTVLVPVWSQMAEHYKDRSRISTTKSSTSRTGSRMHGGARFSRRR